MKVCAASAGFGRRAWLGAAACLLVLPVAAQAPPAELLLEWPDARLQGKGQLRFLGLRVYDIRLWTGARAVSEAIDDWVGLPLALEIEYRRSIDGMQIAERSLVEMRRQGDIAPANAERWLAVMKQAFPDVRAGDRLTGVNVPGLGARFFVNGQLKAEIRETEFARLFFGIWLSPRSSEPALRQALLATPRNTP